MILMASFSLLFRAFQLGERNENYLGHLVSHHPVGGRISKTEDRSLMKPKVGLPRFRANPRAVNFD